MVYVSECSDVVPNAWAVTHMDMFPFGQPWKVVVTSSVESSQELLEGSAPGSAKCLLINLALRRRTCSVDIGGLRGLRSGEWGLHMWDRTQASLMQEHTDSVGLPSFPVCTEFSARAAPGFEHTMCQVKKK